MNIFKGVFILWCQRTGVQTDPRRRGRWDQAAFGVWSPAGVPAPAGWKSLAMWFTWHQNQITLPGIPPAGASVQRPADRRRWRTAADIICCEMGGGEDGGRESSHCRCLFENTSAWQNAFIPSSPCNYGTDALSNAQHFIFVASSPKVDGLFFRWHTWVNRALLPTYRLRTNL